MQLMNNIYLIYLYYLFGQLYNVRQLGSTS